MAVRSRRHGGRVATLMWNNAEHVGPYGRRGGGAGSVRTPA
ncbi:hypothetical protein SFR_3389 [Streptomyces sp. FR-008]|nr:hypothetical protein SFR_3389 [Streptomyces sp. FR-008]